jgi:hypothetical protein
MALVARTWVGGEVITAAKLNTLRDDLLFLQSIMPPKTIQRGTCTLVPSATTGTGSITAVASVAVAELAYLGENFPNPGSGTGSVLHASRLALTNTTTVTATRTSGDNTNGTNGIVNFQVTEWF